MKRDIGASAGFLALLALFVHTQLPNPENGVPSNRTSDSRGSEQKSSAGSDQGEVIDGPWLAIQAFFRASAASLETLEPGREKNRSQTNDRYHDIVAQLTSPGKLDHLDFSTLLALKMAPAGAQRWSIVASVADPLHTHMSLFLDEQMEAIERSVQARGWSFAGQWLPWSDRFSGNEADMGKRRSQRWLQRHQEEMPGVLIFQSARPGSSDALFVFVVPETVTGGISGPAFYAAMHLAYLLSQPQTHQIGLLAPTFSGSFKSFSKLLTNMKNSGGPVNIVPTVYGGTVSSLAAATDFVAQTSSIVHQLSFHGGILDSHDYLEAFCYVVQKYQLDRRAAVLVEDESGLGQTLKDHVSCTDQLEFYVFPREISSLRNAYRDLPAPSAGNQYGDQSARLDFSIRDPTSGEDSIPTFSEAQTPLMQDTILNSITQELNRRHTHIVFLSVTNPLDALFLSQVLRSACPDARVIIQGPNTLFVAAAARQPLDGTIFLSPYPMFFQGDEWLTPKLQTPTDRPGHDRIMFAISSLQGMYNVTQFLLNKMHATEGGELDLRGYGQPAEVAGAAQPYPGVWLLTLNRFGFLPVDLLNRKVLTIRPNSGDKDWFDHNPIPSPALPSKLSPLEAPRSWLITMFVVSVTIFVVCCTFLRCNFSQRRAKPLWLVFSDGYVPRFEALLCACLSLTAIEWFLASPLTMPWSAFFTLGTPREDALKATILLGLATPLVTLSIALLLFGKRLRIREKWCRNVIYLAMPVLLFVLAVLGWDQLCNDPQSGLFFRFRAQELYSGSSPAIPLVFAGLVFFFIAAVHLKQYAFAGVARPRLALHSGSASAYQGQLQTTYQSVEDRIMAPWFLKPANLFSRVVVTSASVLTCFVILGVSSASAFELPKYNRLLLIAIVTILLCVTTKWYDLLMLWLCVKRFLSLVQVLPLQSTIERVAMSWPKRPIWGFSGAVPKAGLQREMLYALHRRAISARHVAVESNTGIAAIEATEKDLNDFRELVFGKQPDSNQQSQPSIKKPANELSGREEIENNKKHEGVSARVAADIYEHELVPAWRLSLLDETDRAAGEEKIVSREEPESWHAKYLQYCADFVALQFCSFIVYTVGQIKRMATSLSLTFVLLALLLNSYSPEGRQLVARFLGVLFLGIGYVVWRVFSQMERNTILSAISHTTPGQLGAEFWVQLVTLGVLPLLGVVGHLFPSISQFLSQWITPNVQGMH